MRDRVLSAAEVGEARPVAVTTEPVEVKFCVDEAAAVASRMFSKLGGCE